MMYTSPELELFFDVVVVIGGSVSGLIEHHTDPLF